MKIIGVLAREIYDSRGLPTVQCQLVIENGISVCSSVPSGLSTGSFEARELRDGGDRLFGKGVLDAIQNIEEIIGPKIIGTKVDAVEIDKLIIELDGTSNKYNLGANAMLAVSMSAYRAQAFCEHVELYQFLYHLLGNPTIKLPQPFFTIINGSQRINNQLYIQEFMILPVGIVNFRSALESGVTFFHELKHYLIAKGKPISVDDEGAFSAAFSSDDEALDVLHEIMSVVYQKYGYSYVVGLDIGASDYYDDFKNLYNFQGNFVTASQMIDYYERLLTKYPIYSIEDGLSEIDYSGWATMTARLKSNIQIIGDKIFSTNIYRIAQGIGESLATSVIIKPNEAGTITETLQAMQLCKDMNINSIISHCSGETEDTFIADLAVGAGSDQIKFGSLCRGERVCKYNRLLYIEDKLSLGDL